MNCLIKKQPKLFFLLLLFPFMAIEAQTDSASSAGSASFKMTRSKNFWMGSNYRKEWTTSIKAPILNLAAESGGLTPVRMGGGKQTKSLRLEDANGRQYVLRSIEKFITAKTLPPELQSEAAEDLVADGVSASYPYATLSIPPLADAVSVPYGKVKLVYVPDDARLGEFRQEFGNILALFEERLSSTVDKGYSTEEVADKLKEDNDDNVDQPALLRARILDMFVMDLDRHEDQWQWGAIDKEKGKTYFPIPRDRDQAFFTNQGVIPGIIKWPWLVPQLEGFKAKAKNINRFNFAARNLDRFFLNELNEQDWQKAVEDFLPKMTDELIEKALNQQPAAIRPVSADKLISNLKERRQFLAGEVMQYYRFLSEIVNITGSDKKELFDITKNSDGSVQVQVYKITKEGEQSIKMYDRTFDPSVTKELRLYAFGGEDKFVIKGDADKIKIRMIGGEGDDLFESVSGGKGIVYDLKDGNNTISGKLKNKMANDTLVNSYERIYYKYNQVIPFVSINYNRDDGLFLGFSLKFINHGFRKTPYKNTHEFMINHALSTKAFNFRYYAEYIGVVGKNTDLLTDFDIKAPNNTTNFFGYGGASVYDKSKPGEFRYYRARYSLGDLSILLRKRFSEKVMFTFGPTYQFYSLDSTQNLGRNIITPATLLDPTTLYAKQSYVGGKISLLADTRDHKVVPQKGIFWQTSLRHLSGLNDESYTVTQLNSDFTFYLNIIPKKLVLANRIGGGHNFGDFEFYQAQYLGSEDNLRGYRKYRFAGRSKLYNNTELRLALANFRTYLFPGVLGI
ncbi:MAG TPA: BamA/TamA family outer membrane protein, partial [Chitinophagaceae bacterium]|nr:BamA/TamA family outer membrane protein [Chitinophagaceae bacterium]